MKAESSMSDTPQLLVDAQWKTSTVALRCAGVVDMLTEPDLRQQIDNALDRSPSAVIVDLTLVDFISSRGLRVLLDTHKRCSPDVDFAVVADGHATLRPMRLTGLTDILSVRSRVDDALADVTAPR